MRRFFLLALVPEVIHRGADVGRLRSRAVRGLGVRIAHLGHLFVGARVVIKRNVDLFLRSGSNHIDLVASIL